MARIAYFVHDLNDPAVARRVRMLHEGGDDVRLVGFYRGSPPPTQIEGANVEALCATSDAAMLQRTLAVLRWFSAPGRAGAAARDADIVIGRNLEALAIAVRTRRKGSRLIYECLDIHRLLLGSSMPARMIQAVEAALLKAVDLVIVSSPAFERHHFAVRSPDLPVALVENRLLALEQPLPASRPAPPGPPWTIGWLGNLRCRRTFDVLTGLARQLDGLVRILVAGRPTTAIFENLPAELERVPNCTYLGPYGPEQLGDIYGQCHFAWLIDWFEEGLNSAWLLPNRLYEAQSFGVVPIALASVEVGRWLQRHGSGVLLESGLADLESRFRLLDAPTYASLRHAVDAIARQDLIADQEACSQLARTVSGNA